MRLRLALLLVFGAVAAMLVGPVSGAQAYPATTCSTLSVSTTHPNVGEAITLTGSAFTPRTKLRLELHTKVYVLGFVTTDGNGTFSTKVTMPAGVTGNHLIFAIGDAKTGSCPVDPSQSLEIQAASTGTTGGGSSDNGGLASTGLDIALLLLVAALLIGVGVVLNRRRPAVVEARKSASY